MTATPPGDQSHEPQDQSPPAPPTPVGTNGQHQTHDEPVKTD
jgi:hypothetical protein